MQPIIEEEIEIHIANAKRPFAHTNFPYPLNLLDDRIYEVLTYSIFKRRLASNEVEITKKYDDVFLMQGVGEKGMDCRLVKNAKIAAVIQCKKYSKNISDIQILNELIKFTIHFSRNQSQFVSSNKFRYIIATTTGFTEKSINLINQLLDGSFKDIYDIKKIFIQVISKNKSFNSIKFEEIESEIIKTISNFEYELLRPEDYNLWINKFPEIIDTYFDIKKVTDNSEIIKSKREIIQTIQSIFSNKETENINEFLKKYKTIGIEKLNIVNFIGFDLHRYRQKPTDITLTELFVHPNFSQKIIEKGNKTARTYDKDQKIAQIFKSEKHIILLGDPGAGKSLFVKYIIVKILEGNSEKIGLKQYAKHVPFRIELRKYNEVRETRNIIEYLCDILTKEYQILITTELLNKVIQNMDSIIFFDGLDEIFNVTHKNKMKESIELFSSIFPKSKCIVTSRFIGYHDIKFNPKKYDEFAILKFKHEQISELISKFYATQIANTEKRKHSVESCLLQIEKDVDDELKSNPLIMTLILILTSNNIIIPDSKLEIYEACTKTLVDSIDTREKELKFEMPVKNKRLTFAHLAYWQYESMSKSQNVSYDSAVKVIASLLIDKKEVTEYTEAEEKATKFLEYAEKRSIYFEDNFTHKTFLEYYTADHLYINYFTKANDAAKRKVLSLITTYLPKSFWYIVFELLLTRVDKEQADSELLDEIFAKQLESTSLNVFYFLISNLPKIINVSDEIKNKIIKKTILLLIKGEKITETKQDYNFQENSLLGKINLLQSNPETLNLLQEVIFEIEESNINENELIELYVLYHEIQSFNRRGLPSNLLKIKNASKYETLAYKDLHLFCQAMVRYRNKEESIPLEVVINQIKHFGAKSLFKEVKFRYRNASRIDTFNVYLMSTIENQDHKSFRLLYDELINNDIKHEQIIDHLTRNRIYFFYREENFEKILTFYLKTTDARVDEIIMTILQQDIGMQRTYHKYRSKNNNPKLKNLDRIYNKF